MIEVEVRSKINSLPDLKNQLKEISAKFIKKERQIDKIFAREKDLDSSHQMIEGRFVGRIRQKGDKILLELKEIRRTGAGLEFSSPVTKIEDGVLLLNSLDYVESFSVSKIRDVYEYSDFEICIDDVEELGFYIEIEHHDNSGNDKEKAMKECKEFLHKLIPDAKIENKKYGDLIQEKKNNS